MQRTEKYFEQDAFRTECESVILAAEPDEKTGGGRIALDGTVFYPEGGGQPADRGTLTLPDGTVVTGKTSSLLGASAALLLNALKKMAGIDHKLDLIPSSVIEPISAMKTGCLGHRNPRLHSDEVLIALAISGLTNPLAAMVQAQLKNLRGCEAHFSVIISEEDAKLYKRLGINVSCEAKYEVKSLYHK